MKEAKIVKENVFLRALLLGAIFYLLAAALRLDGLMLVGPQADERLWLDRSYRVWTKLQEDPAKATTHLGHPGIPPALLMAGAHWFALHYNGHYRLYPDSPGYLGTLEACRIVIAASAALIAPVVLWGAWALIGFWPALIASGLVTLDPRMVGFARIAHLDALLTLFVTSSVFLYVLAVQRRRVWLKLLAGCCWGLAIATKPTAGMLLPIFMLYKFLRQLLVLPRNDRGERALVTWSDFGAFLMGHAVFALLYTRLWDHAGDYLVRLKVRIPLAGWLWQWGNFLQENPSVFVVLAAAGLLGLWGAVRMGGAEGGSWRRHFSMLLLFTGLLSVGLFLMPQVFENIVRFWKWSSGLSSMTHKAYGHVVAPIQYGYGWLLLTNLPALALFGVLCGAVAWVRKFLNVRRAEIIATIGLCVIAPLVWMIFLSASAKQSWRYALPVVPLIYTFAAFGLYGLIGLLGKRLPQACRGWAAIVGLAVLFSWQTWVTLSWHPYYLVFCNNLTGGLRGALARGQHLPFIGQRDIVQALLRETEGRSDYQKVTVVGDRKVLEGTYEMFTHGREGSILFNDYAPSVSDFLVVFNSHRYLLDEQRWAETLQSPPLTIFEWRGARLVELYRAQPPSYSEPFKIITGVAHHLTGRLQKLEGTDQRSIVVEPGVDSPGFAFFYYPLHVSPGRYRLAIALQKPAGELRTTGVVARLDLAPQCSRAVMGSDLGQLKPREFVLDCLVTQTMRLAPRLEWLGDAGLVIGDAEMRKAAE